MFAAISASNSDQASDREIGGPEGRRSGPRRSLVGLQAQRDRVDAVALVGRGVVALALEDVPQVAAAGGTAHLGARAAGQRAVLEQLDRLAGQRGEERRPAAVAVELGLGGEQLGAAGPALVRTPGLRNLTSFGTRESARVGGRLPDSPSTIVRLCHLAGVYYCLNSKSHLPFVLELSLRSDSQCRPPRELSSPSRT